MNATTQPQPENVVPLAVQPAPKRGPERLEDRFKIQEFTNPRTNSVSYRVFGIKRDGTRIRQNFVDENAAIAKRLELNTEYWGGQPTETTLRATTLSDVQIKLAEAAFAILPEHRDILPAVRDWVTKGKHLAVAESPRLDEAVDCFLKWVDDPSAKLRERYKGKLRSRVKMFRSAAPNLRVADITPEAIEDFLATRSKVCALTREGDLQAVSRFFTWCIRGRKLGAEKPNRWIKLNPCQQIEIESDTDREPPAILSLDECKKVLRAAEQNEGRLAPYVAVCLFGGLRPTEAARLTWDKVNLADKEIRVEIQSTKVKRPRIVEIDSTLARWLSVYRGLPFKPSNMRRCLDEMKRAAGYVGRKSDDKKDDGLKVWPPDVLRHTGISHFTRKTGSYGEAARQFGTSERMIKNHYEGRVSTEDMEKFYAIMPKKRIRN